MLTYLQKCAHFPPIIFHLQKCAHFPPIIFHLQKCAHFPPIIFTSKNMLTFLQKFSTSICSLSSNNFPHPKMCSFFHKNCVSRIYVTVNLYNLKNIIYNNHGKINKNISQILSYVKVK